MSETLNESWDSYAERVLPKNAPPVQIQETRRAFYAGAQALFTNVMQALDPGTEPTADDLRYMDALVLELAQFFADVKAGKA